MTWQTAKLVCESIALLALAGSALFSAYLIREGEMDLHSTQVKAQQSLTYLSATLNAVNAPCIGFHGSVTCGPLAQLSQTEKNVGILAAQAALQVKNSAQISDSAAEAVKGASADIHQIAQNGSQTLQAATGTLQAIQADAVSAQPILAAAQGTVMKLGTAADSLNALLKSEAINRTIKNVADLTGNLNGVASNLDATTAMVNHKLQPILEPKPCPKRNHLACVLRRHTLGYLMGGARFGEALYWTRANF